MKLNVTAFLEQQWIDSDRKLEIHLGHREHSIWIKHLPQSCKNRHPSRNAQKAAVVKTVMNVWMERREQETTGNKTLREVPAVRGVLESPKAVGCSWQQEWFFTNTDALDGLVSISLSRLSSLTSSSVNEPWICCSGRPCAGFLEDKLSDGLASHRDPEILPVWF